MSTHSFIKQIRQAGESQEIELVKYAFSRLLRLAIRCVAES
jgi:hypothetical protein